MAKICEIAKFKGHYKLIVKLLLQLQMLVEKNKLLVEYVLTRHPGIDFTLAFRTLYSFVALEEDMFKYL